MQVHLKAIEIVLETKGDDEVDIIDEEVDDISKDAHATYPHNPPQ